MPARSITLFLLSLSLNATLSAQDPRLLEGGDPQGSRYSVACSHRRILRNEDRRPVSLAGGPEESRSFRLDESAERLHAVGSRPHPGPRKTARPHRTTRRHRSSSEFLPILRWPLVLFEARARPGQPETLHAGRSHGRQSASCWIQKLSPPTACTTRSTTTRHRPTENLLPSASRPAAPRTASCTCLTPPLARILASASIAPSSPPSPGCPTTAHFSTTACTSSVLTSPVLPTI